LYRIIPWCLKKELIYQQQYATRAQAQQDIWEYIEKFSIIVKESIQQMTIYRQHRKNVCTN
jgi:hypothetical protein